MNYHPESWSALRSWNMNTSDELLDLADSVLREIDEIEPMDLTHPWVSDRAVEIADSAVPVMNSDILDAVASDHGLMLSEPECGPAFGGEATVINIAAGNLYELASNIAHSYLNERIKAEEEMLDEMDEAIHEYEIAMEARKIVDQAAFAWYMDQWIAVLMRANPQDC